jgi:hypothetical protein
MYLLILYNSLSFLIILSKNDLRQVNVFNPDECIILEASDLNEPISTDNDFLE